jgi:hypothetical protein
MLFDIWLVIVTLLSFVAMALFAIGCDRLMGTKR